MKNISVMSRAELVDELIASHRPAINSDPPAAYHASHTAITRAPHDAIVCHKLSVARELLLRDLADQMKSGPVLSSPDAVRDWLRLHCANLAHEVFIVLHLDVRHRLIDAQELFRGTLTQTSVYPREVVKSSLERNTASVLLAHNHPSGNTEPSQADRVLTQQLASALSLVDVRVVDHFIVAGDQILSFAERGLI